jgi:putative endonuclease
MKEYFYVYIMTNFNNRALYIGMTSNLPKRVWEHQNGVYENAHTKKYKINKLVYYEVYDSFEAAAHRENCMKEWQRAWKIKLVDGMNPGWDDLGKRLN